MINSKDIEHIAAEVAQTLPKSDPKKPEVEKKIDSHPDTGPSKKSEEKSTSENGETKIAKNFDQTAILKNNDQNSKNRESREPLPVTEHRTGSGPIMISDCEMDISESESTKEAEANRQKRLRSTEAENPAKVRKFSDKVNIFT